MGAHEVSTASDRPLRRDSTPDLAPWVASHGPRLRLYFARRAPADDVDDLVQDVFLRLQSARTNGPIRDMECYLFTVARHVLVNRQRSLAVRCSALHDRLDDVPEPASDLSPERIVSARQDFARAMVAVGELPPRARAAFQLYRFDELSYAAIAERMAISRASVKELLHRAAAGVRVSQNGGSQTVLAKYSKPHPPRVETGASK